MRCSIEMNTFVISMFASNPKVVKVIFSILKYLTFKTHYSDQCMHLVTGWSVCAGDVISFFFPVEFKFQTRYLCEA